jgi:hypothetical protein
MLMAKLPSFVNNDLSQQQQQQQHHHRHQKHQQQLHHHQRIIDHVNRVMEWVTQLRIVPTPSLRCDAMQVLSYNGLGAAAVRELVEQWRSQGIKLSEKEYSVAILAESNAIDLLQRGRYEDVNSDHLRSQRRLDVITRVSHLITCAIADGTVVTTPIMNAVLAATASPCSSPPPLSSVMPLIPSPVPAPDAITVDIIAAAYASAADVNIPAAESEQILMNIFNMKPVVFLGHTLPPPSHATLVAVVKACVRHHRYPLAIKLMSLACDRAAATHCLLSPKACKTFSVALRRGVISQT